MATVIKGGVKDRIVHEVGRAIKQAQIEWCSVGCVRACTGRWLVLSLDSALLHGLHTLTRGYWPAVATLLDKTTLTTLETLPYATSPLARGRSWVCLCLNEGQLENYLHVLTSHQTLLKVHYGPQALLRDPHRAHILLMLAAGLEHIKVALPMEIPGWMQAEGSLGSSSTTSMTSMSVSMASMGSSTLPSPSIHNAGDLDTTCSEALEEMWLSIEGELPVFNPGTEEVDTSIEIEHIAKSSRRKRRSQSSSRGSSRVPSGGTTPTEPLSSFKINPDTPVSPSDEVTPKQELETNSCDSRTDVLLEKYSCDNNYSKDVLAKAETINKENLKFREKLLKEVNRDNLVHRDENIINSVNQKVNDEQKITEEYEKHEKEDKESVVVRRRLPSSRSVDKRVSFTASNEEHQKIVHNRLSLCDGIGGGAEIRDLSDLRNLLCSLRDKGLLPTTLALDDLFSSIDQSTPALSERAPPEGQEDPPMHQSIVSLGPTININNNNIINDDSNNNKNSASDDDVTVADEVSEDAVLQTIDVKDCEIPPSLYTQNCDIIDSARWEELTRIGHEMLGKPGGPDEDILTAVHRSMGNDSKHWATGARPKQRPGATLRADALIRGRRSDWAVHGLSRKDTKAHERRMTPAERKLQYKRLYREARRLPSLYIPHKVDTTNFKEEESRLALEVAQGQSNLVVAGHVSDSVSEEHIAQVFTAPQEKLYRIFSVREGHSSGRSLGVQVVLSSHAIYVITRIPRGVKLRHTVPYYDIHTVIVGANDQWVCVLSKEAVRDDLATTGTNTGIQLEVGDPDITHALVSCLEVAIRRYLISFKKPEVEKSEVVKPEKSCCTELLSKIEQCSKITKDCDKSLSKSHLEESLLSAWNTRKDSCDASPGFSDQSQESSAVTPVSIDVSRESTDAVQDLTDYSMESTDASHVSKQASQESSDISQEGDTSQMSNNASQDSSDISQDSVDYSQESSSISRESTCLSQESSGMSQETTETSENSSETSNDPSYDSHVLTNIAQRTSNGNQATSNARDKPVGNEKEEPAVVQLHLEKQYGLQSYGRGHMQWNGSMLERSLPAVIVHPAWELAGLRKWLRSQLRLQSGPEVIGCWLADWEDGSSLGSRGTGAGPLGPASEGPLMFKPPGLLASWRPAYFILKAGVLYQFNDSRERLPHMIVEVVQCVGCVRIASAQRPHAFQLLRKNAPAVMLAASDEQEASLWLQAFLTIINSGVRDISERGQVACRVILLDSGVLLAQQSDMILGSPPHDPTSAPEHQSTPEAKLSSCSQHSQGMLGTSPKTHIVHSQVKMERKDSQKLLAMAALSDHKALSSSLTTLNRTNSTSSLPSSPMRRRNTKERKLGTVTSIPDRHSLTRTSNGGLHEISPIGPNRKASSASKPSTSSPYKTSKVESVSSQKEYIMEGFKPKGEVKVLTYSALEQVTSISVYAECPNTCLVEFECSEAGEISGDWALYFRCGTQLQEFITTLARTWRSLSQVEFPLHTVEDAGVQQFLLEGSLISSKGWSSPNL